MLDALTDSFRLRLSRSHLLRASTEERPFVRDRPAGCIIRHSDGKTLTTFSGEITQLLAAWKTGDRTAEARLFEMLMPELRKIAIVAFRNERPGHTLQPTALINEAFLRLVKAKNVDWQDRGHFLAVAAKAMRRCLIDHARARPDVSIVPLEEFPSEVMGDRSQLEMVVALDVLLDELQQESAQQRAVVELKFLLGFTDSEAADALHLTLHTFQREWYRARRWLFERLTATAWQKDANQTSA